jgi:5-methylcytosine-specific restriction endonuclease McrA
MKWWYRKKRCKSWIAWRTKVYERDSYTCVLCGKRNRIMNPHHILPKSIFPKLKYVVSNGATLCRKCHKRTFKKELTFVELIVDRLFGGTERWRLLKHWMMLKNQKIGSKKQLIQNTKVIALQ